MKQVFAIFAKDARRFWPEIVVVLGLLAALLLAYPAMWRADTNVHTFSRIGLFLGQDGKGFLASCVVVLIPIAWLVLIARVVHCERLVGDTQFWLTRPYDWTKLLAAKLLFLAAFLYAPFFVAQCVLLKEAGFAPLQHLAGLLFNLLLLTVVGVLPLMALSSLTRGFGRLTLVILGIILTVVVVAAISNSLPSMATGGVPDLISGDLGLGAIFCGSLAVILVMYARRNGKAAWMVTGALVLILCATAFYDPDRPLMERYYPELPAGRAAPATFTYGSNDLGHAAANETEDRRSVDMGIPLQVSGVQDGYAVIPVAVRAAITNGNGPSWESPWNGIESVRLIPGSPGVILRFRMPRNVYDQFKSSPVTLRLSIALAQARRTSEEAIALPEDDFAVREIGVCRPQRWGWSPEEVSGLACRSAMNQPQLTYVSATWSSGGCKAGQTNVDYVQGSGWVGELDPGPAEFGITSVWDAPVNLSAPWASQDWRGSGERWSICASTPVRFAQYRPVLRGREEVTLAGFRLPDLALGDQYKLLLPK